MGKDRRDGDGSYYRLPDGGWMAQVRVYDPTTGRSRKVRRRARSEAAAKRALKELRATSHAPAPQAGLTVVGYLQQWASTTLPVSGRKPSTVRQYTELIASPITPTLQGVRMDKFTPAEVERWLARLNAYTSKRSPKGEPKPLAQSTKRSAFAVVSLACDTAVRDGLLAANPCKSVQRPPKGQVTVRALTAGEVEQVIAEAHKGDGYWAPLVVFVANTGLRISEALDLKWVDVDLTAAEARILDSKTPSGKRTIPLVPDVVDALTVQRSRQRQWRLQVGPGWRRTGLVFTTGAGTAIDPHNARRAQRRLLKAAGLPPDNLQPFHTMRHSLATRLLEHGIPMPIVSRLLGHSSIRTTVDMYGHLEAALDAHTLDEALRSTR